MRKPPREAHVLVVRLRFDPREMPNGAGQWRGSIDHVRRGRQAKGPSFSSLDELFRVFPDSVRELTGRPEEADAATTAEPRKAVP